jgi:RNA polymerase sigma factor (sigma-70 family)
MDSDAIDDRGFTANPRDPAEWQRLIDAVQPAAMLFRIESRMSSELRQRVASEDIWQETLLCAWRDRDRLDWRGLPAFRQWLIEIAENRIRDAVERQSAAKREAPGRRAVAIDAGGWDPSTNGMGANLPAREKTPPSVAVHVERAQVIREALEGLPEHFREVLRLRLFEEWDRDRIAGHLGLSIPAVKHRIRLGAALYRDRLALVLSSRRSVVAEGRGRGGLQDQGTTDATCAHDARDD